MDAVSAAMLARRLLWAPAAAQDMHHDLRLGAEIGFEDVVWALKQDADFAAHGVRL